MTKLFFFCLGLFLASTFCMKTVEKDLARDAPSLSVMKLELTYSAEETASVLSAADPVQKDKLRYVLLFDFAFMAGCFPGIALLCLLVRKKIRRPFIRTGLLILAGLQALAWAFDIYENSCLLQWNQNPVIGDNFSTYRLLVQVKWIIALAAVAVVLVSSLVLLFRKKTV